MTGKNPRTTNVNYLRPDFSFLLLGECLQILATDKHEKSELSLQRDNGTAVLIKTMITFIRKDEMQFCNIMRRQGIEYVRIQEACGLVGEINKEKGRRQLIKNKMKGQNFYI
jgi:hypothetical protein